jgi:hypothetical protein
MRGIKLVDLDTGGVKYYTRNGYRREILLIFSTGFVIGIVTTLITLKWF